jgi:predicted lipoprotein with Yx(FWY)xxD motif
MNLLKKLPQVIAAIAVMFASWSCSKNNTPDQPAPANAVRLSANATFGNILTDAKGKTLYFFAIDANGNSGCSGQCSVAWPTFYQADLTLDKGLDSKDFATITRTDGAKQTTYKGWPLYYFQNDANAGDVKGDKVGNTWFVAKPDYTVMVSNSQLVGNDGVKYDSNLKPGDAVTQYIVDDRGQTLYSFSHDKFKINNFTNSTFSNNKVWPIDTAVKAVLNVPSVLDKTQFQTITVFGKTQLVYKGWPLYYFGADNNLRGNNKGVSVPTPGTWPYINATSPVAPN